MADESETLSRAVVEDDNFRLLDLFLDSGAEVDGLLDAALSEAVRCGNIDHVEFLLDKGPVVKESNALSEAVSGGFTDIVQLLLDAGADVNESDALSEAVALGNTDIVKLLLDADYDVDMSDALSKAVALGNTDMVKLLLNADDCVHVSDALSKAAALGNTDMVKLLLDADYDVDMSYALSNAAEGGHVEIVELLLEKGADANEPYALVSAASRGHKYIVRLLLDKGADWSQMKTLREAVASDQASKHTKDTYEKLDQDRVTKIKEEFSMSSKSNVQDHLFEQICVKEEQSEQQQQQFTEGKSENVKSCNITITVVGDKRVGKSCLVRQIKKQCILEGEPQPKDTIDLCVNYFAFNPNNGFKKKLDETGQQRLRRIIDRYRKRETTDKESSQNLSDQDAQQQMELSTKTEPGNMVTSTPSSIASSPLPSVPSPQSSASTSTTKRPDIQRKRKSHTNLSRSKDIKRMKLSFEQRNVIKEILQTETPEGGEQMKGLVTIYDFGDAHHCFMSSNMVFVLVFDVALCIDPSRSKDGYERIENWLKYIGTYAFDQTECGKGTPPVILVGSHLDVISPIKQEQAEGFGTVLEKLYENPQLSKIMENHVQEMYPIGHLNDSEKNQDIYEVVWNKIIEIAPLQSQWGKPVSARGLALEQQVLKRKNAGRVILTYEELLEISSKLAVPLTDHGIMEFLRNLRFGGPLFCSDLRSRRPFVILRPQWITDTFKPVITIPKFTVDLSAKLILQWKQYEKSGEIKIDLIRELWGRHEDSNFLSNEKLLCNAMETLGLLAPPLSDNSGDEVDYFIVPSMLPTADLEIIRPVLDGPGTVITDTLCLKFDNPFIPQAVWDKMIAACIHRFQRLNEPGQDGSKFIQRGFVCLSVDYLWNMIINCSENVMKITMFKKHSDQSIPTGTGYQLLTIIEFHLNRILELNHQSNLRYQFYLHNDYRISTDDKMVKVDDLRQTSRLQCYGFRGRGWIHRRNLHFWFKSPKQKTKRLDKGHGGVAEMTMAMAEKNVSFKEAGRISRCIGSAYQMFFAALDCPVEEVEQGMEENRHLAFRSRVTKILIQHLKKKPDTTFADVADAMSKHGMDASALPRIFDCNRDTTFEEETLPESCLYENLSVSDVSVIAQHLDIKAYPNLFIELGFSPNTIDEFDVDFRNKKIGVQISAMLEAFIKDTNPCPTVNTILLAMQECNMNATSLKEALAPKKTSGVTVYYQRDSVPGAMDDK